MIPAVSVIIPVYKVEDYIERCSRSLFEQSLANMEYIFVDDCSPDNSIQILSKVIEEYPNRKSQVKIVRTPVNSGLPMARRYGLQFISGEYVIHCDSDDWVDLTMYEEMYNIAENYGYDIVMTSFQLSSSKAGFHNDDYISNDKQEIMRNLLIGKCHSSLCTKLVRTGVYDNKILYPLDNMREDMVLAVQLVYYANKVGQYDNAPYHYFVNPDSISRVTCMDKIFKRFEQSVNNIGIIEEFIKREDLLSVFVNDIRVLRFMTAMELWPFIHTSEGLTLCSSLHIKLSLFEILCFPVPISFKVKYALFKLGLESLFS